MNILNALKMIPRPDLKKIPGELPKYNADVYVKDISKLTTAELLEMRDRELKLLSNKARLAKLPDKGKKIQEFYVRIEKELAIKDEIEKASNMFSELNIASKGKDKMNTLEWTRDLDANREDFVLDSDDEEETNPLKIIAQSRDVEKKIKYIKPEVPLITEKDLQDIRSFNMENGHPDNNEMNDDDNVLPAEIIEVDVKSKKDAIKSILNNKMEQSAYAESSTSSTNLEPHVLYLCRKEECAESKKEKFKPYKTTKTDVHDPEKEKFRKQGKHWEITAATPPPILHPGTIMLTLHDSVDIQTEYLRKVKEWREKQAQERLAAKVKLNGVPTQIMLPDENLRKLNKFFGSYRQTSDSECSDNESDQKTNSDEDVHDEEEETGIVTYNVYK